MKKGDKQKIVKVRFLEEIVQLRNEGWSWRNIEEYLSRYRNFKISYRHLKDIIHPESGDNQPVGTPAYDTVEVERLTGLATETCDSLAGYFAGLPDEDRIKVHQLQTDMIRQHREKNIDKGPEFFYAMFLLALHKMCNAENKSAGVSLAAGPEKKSRTKKEKVKKYYDQVKKQRDDGWSWQRIARNLAQYNRIKIGHVWLQHCFEQIAAERQAKKSREAEGPPADA